jgi:hypothetical protein
LFCVLLLCVTRYTLTSELWFGHLIISDFSLKFSMLVVFLFIIFFSALGSLTNFYAREIFDFCTVCVQFCLWFTFLFSANSFFCVFFFFEIIATLVFLLLVTSCFSATGNFAQESMASFSYFAAQLPNFYLNSLLFFFWMSMLASIGLFFFSMHFIFWFYSFEWSLLELMFVFQVAEMSSYQFATQAACWLGLILCLFIKCGVAPFFVWKPAFFKGIPLITVFFYTVFYYFFLLTFIFLLLTSYANEIFVTFIYFHLLLVSGGLLITVLVFTEVTHLKPFFAFSSIVNSLFMFAGLVGSSTSDLVVFF